MWWLQIAETSSLYVDTNLGQLKWQELFRFKELAKREKGLWAAHFLLWGRSMTFCLDNFYTNCDHLVRMIFLFEGSTIWEYRVQVYWGKIITPPKTVFSSLSAIFFFSPSNSAETTFKCIAEVCFFDVQSVRIYCRILWNSSKGSYVKVWEDK